jgi:putative membrane protein
MNRPARLLLAAALAATPVIVVAQTPPPPPPAEAKTTADAYVTAAGKSDLYEINSSQIALQKSQNAGVRKFAQMMIDHHQKTTAATVKAAQKAGLNPAPPALDAGATASINELQAATGTDFDRLYLGQQLPAHQAALDLHQSYAAGGDKAPLKASARAAVPIVKRHIAEATRLQGSSTASGM